MAKITIPVDSAKNGGALYTLVDDLTNLNSLVSRTRENDNLIINDAGVPTDQSIELDQTLLLSILAEGGEAEEYLMGIKQPTSFASTDVPAGLPYRLNVLGDAREFKEWFIEGAEVWIKDTNDFFIYYTNPAAGLAAPSEYLKGSEMEIIRQLDTVNISILSVEEVQAEIATGYTKVVW